MTIEERAELGAELKKKCNCCQAVLLALKDQTGLSEEQLIVRSHMPGSDAI